MARVNRGAVLAVVRRDLRTVVRNRVVLGFFVLLAVVMLLLPPVTVALAGATGAGSGSPAPLLPMLARLPGDLVESLPADVHRQIVALLVFAAVPLYLLAPLLLGALTAADNVAGERERGTLEVLLHSPLTDGELLAGKLVASWTVATVGGGVLAVAYAAVAEIMLGRYGMPAVFPNRAWVVLLLWVTPAAAAVGAGVILAAAGRLRTAREAGKVAVFFVLPVAALMAAQVAGFVVLDALTLGVVGLVCWLLFVGLLRGARRAFRRDRLLTRDDAPGVGVGG